MDLHPEPVLGSLTARNVRLRSIPCAPPPSGAPPFRSAYIPGLLSRCSPCTMSLPASSLHSSPAAALSHSSHHAPHHARRGSPDIGRRSVTHDRTTTRCGVPLPAVAWAAVGRLGPLPSLHHDYHGHLRCSRYKGCPESIQHQTAAAIDTLKRLLKGADYERERGRKGGE